MENMVAGDASLSCGLGKGGKKGNIIVPPMPKGQPFSSSAGHFRQGKVKDAAGIQREKDEVLARHLGIHEKNSLQTEDIGEYDAVVDKGPVKKCPRCMKEIREYMFDSHWQAHSSEIIPGFLYLGGRRNVENSKEVLMRTKITHFVNVSEDENALPLDLQKFAFTQKHVVMKDGPNEKMGQLFHLIQYIRSLEVRHDKFILKKKNENKSEEMEGEEKQMEGEIQGKEDELKDNREKEDVRVLLHCVQGISRSATVCIAYLIMWKGMPLKMAYNFVKERRPLIDPRPNFIKILQDVEHSVFRGEPSLTIQEVVNGRTYLNVDDKVDVEAAETELANTILSSGSPSGSPSDGLLDESNEGDAQREELSVEMPIPDNKKGGKGNLPIPENKKGGKGNLKGFTAEDDAYCAKLKALVSLQNEDGSWTWEGNEVLQGLFPNLMLHLGFAAGKQTTEEDVSLAATALSLIFISRTGDIEKELRKVMTYKEQRECFEKGDDFIRFIEGKTMYLTPEMIERRLYSSLKRKYPRYRGLIATQGHFRRKPRNTNKEIGRVDLDQCKNVADPLASWRCKKSADINTKFEWNGKHQIIEKTEIKSGSGGFVLGRLADDSLVGLKGLGQNALEQYIADRLAVFTESQVARMRFLSMYDGSDEYFDLQAGVWKASTPNEEMILFTHSLRQCECLALVEVVPGLREMVGLQGLYQLLNEISEDNFADRVMEDGAADGEKASICRSRLKYELKLKLMIDVMWDLGRLCAYDLLLNNWDRFPSTAWDNEGNLRNIMVSRGLNGGIKVVGIDQAVIPIIRCSGRDRYFSRVHEIIEFLFYYQEEEKGDSNNPRDEQKTASISGKIGAKLEEIVTNALLVNCGLVLDQHVKIDDKEEGEEKAQLSCQVFEKKHCFDSFCAGLKGGLQKIADVVVGNDEGCSVSLSLEKQLDILKVDSTTIFGEESSRLDLITEFILASATNIHQAIQKF